MLGNYWQQTTSVDDIFGCIFFLGALSVNTESCLYGQSEYGIAVRDQV